MPYTKRQCLQLGKSALAAWPGGDDFIAGRHGGRAPAPKPQSLDIDAENKPCWWQAACYIANNLQFKTCQFNRRTRERFYVATGVLSLAIWLFLAAAEIHPPLHAWLHGGTIPDDDDDCAIVAIAHGNVDSVACDVPAVIPVTWIEIVPRIEFSVFHMAIAFLPDGRAPPLPCFAS